MTDEETYETVECDHAKPSWQKYGCPRYCGRSRVVLKLKPELYARTWSSDPVEDEPPYPAPELLAREATDEETPNSARIIAALARANGWTVAVTIARGTPAHATTGRPTAPKTSVLVRAQRADGTRVGAQWLDGTADAKARKVRHPDGRVTDLSDADLRAILRASPLRDSAGG